MTSVMPIPSGGRALCPCTWRRATRIVPVGLVRRGTTWYRRVHVHRHGAEPQLAAGDSAAGKLARGSDDAQAHARECVALARAQDRAVAARVARRAAGRP